MSPHPDRPRAGLRIGVAGVIVAGLVRLAEAQCAMCKTALSESIEGQIIAEGMNRAIILLVAVPAVAVACVGLLIWRAARQPAAEAAPAGELGPKLHA